MTQIALAIEVVLLLIAVFGVSQWRRPFGKMITLFATLSFLAVLGCVMLVIMLMSATDHSVLLLYAKL